MQDTESIADLLKRSVLESPDSVINKLPSKQLTRIEKLVNNFKYLKPLVYTSFDGDYMHYLDWMCYVTQSLEYVPVNPEAALGYYISTENHKGSKIEVMRDCIALELACNEFWIFDKNTLSDLNSLPEGVIAEFILWTKIKTNAPVRHFPWISFDKISKHKKLLKPKNSRLVLNNSLITPQTQKDLLFNITSETLSDLENRLLTSVLKEGTRKLAFLSQDFTDLKHLDWARVLMYRTGFVPFPPDTLLKHFISSDVYKSKITTEYLNARLSLLIASDELWIFTKPSLSLEKRDLLLSNEVVFDLFCWSIYKPNNTIRLLTWRDAQVPKFLLNNLWALTHREHLENTENHE